jgi:hypothetical protein
MHQTLYDGVKETCIPEIHHRSGDYLRLHLPAAEMIQLPLADGLIGVPGFLISHNRLILVGNVR